MKQIVAISIFVAVVFLGAATALLAQYGRGSGYPGSTRGVGMPSSVPGTRQDQSSQEPLASFAGVLRTISSKMITMENADSNTVEFHCSKKTTFYDGTKKVKPSALKNGERVSVEARRGIAGTLEAVNVRIERGKPDPKSP